LTEATPYLLETRGLTKEFNGFLAVNNVNLRVRQGTIHALIGPNGAGKTTVFNLISKFHQPSHGQIFYKGRDITSAQPEELASRGMVRSFQISAVFPRMTVLENVRIALQNKDTSTPYKFWKAEETLNALNKRATSLLEAVGLAGTEDHAASELSYGRKRALEIATTLALDPEVLLLDEPMAGMGHEDIGRISALIRKVAEGRTIVMVEHNLSVVADLSHTITVLQRGEILAEGSYAEVSNNPQVRQAYMGSGTNAKH
jgi:branched-chain amino acid transport system ATP-binding protein